LSTSIVHAKKEAMHTDHFHLNRPVHLARRDVFYEEARTLLQQLSSKETPKEQKQTVDKALFMLLEARHHAEAANQSNLTSTQSQLFRKFLTTVIDNTQSIARMLRRRLSVEEKGGSLTRFLGSDATGNKMSAHYRRCAAHILKGLVLLLKDAEHPYQELRDASLAKMSATDKARYNKARLHFKEQTHSVAERAMAHAGLSVQTSG
jgi:hypothetical protein